MKVLICGGRWLGARALEVAVSAGHEVRLACPAGDDAAAVVARRFGVEVSVAPEAEALQAGDVADADLVLSLHSFRYVSPGALRAARLGVVGYHPSLLPEFPGRNSVADAVRSGASETGGVMFGLAAGWDDGPILLDAAGPIAARCLILPGESPAALWRRALAPIGLALCCRVLVAAPEGRLSRC